MPERTLLLVEDEAIIAMAEAAMLRKNDYAVLLAESGEQAVALASLDPRIDLVLMDIDLGRGMDGTEVARNILACRDIPIVFLSSHTEPEVVEKTEGITSYGYVVKNSGDTVLLASLKMAFRLFDANRTLYENRCRLSEANQIMSGILTNTHMMAAYLDASFNFIWVNDVYAATCGYDPSFFTGKNHFDLYPHPENQAIFRRVVETGTPFYVEAKPFEYPDHPERGETYWDWSLFPITDSVGTVGGLVFTLADVTHRVRAEKKIKLLADMVNGAPGSITVHDYDGRFLYANKKTFEIHGYDEDEFMSLNLHDLDVPESEERLAERFSKIDREGMATFEVAHYRKDGTRFPLEVSARKTTWDGEPAIMSVAADITARKEREREREASIEILRLINEKTDQRDLMSSVALFMREWSGCEAIGIRLAEGDDYPYYETNGFPERFVELENSLCTRDFDGQIVRDVMGHPALECMCGNILRGRFDPSRPFFTERGSFWTNSTTELLAGTTEEDRQSSTRNRCNGMGYESVALVPLRAGDETHGLLQLNDARKDRFTPSTIETIERLCVSIAVALSNRKLVERLVESEKKFHTMVDYTYDWEIWTAPDGRPLHVSRSCERITGYTQDEFMADPHLLTDIVHPDDRAA
ncbi:MAG: PAS domain S-box protein, partial [Spirochaetes bacterium]|nr:PAS domain S-box protein [Spirochaetota bacterium]